ncbi:MAG: hypothetical protein MK101_02600 [Phycisphaerales bacterium]|nr:hypothetical protein [Phycisphaerales bacterium]
MKSISPTHPSSCDDDGARALTHLRRRALVPAIVVWACIAWGFTIGMDPPLDPVAAAWRHAASRFVLVLVAGAVIVWPTSLMLAPSGSLGDMLTESMTLALLLGSAVVAVQLALGHAALIAIGAALLSANWILLLGALSGASGPRSGPMFIAVCLMILGLPAAVFLPAPWTLLFGPLAGVWTISQAHPSAAAIWLATAWPAAAMVALWIVACRNRDPKRGLAL